MKTSSPSPYIPAGVQLPEFSWRAILMGVVLGMLFGASSLYLVLKVGLTVSASIPVAVIAITLFRLNKKLGGRDSSILENSITQTAGSAGESIAFGLGATMPAILILGFDLEIARVMLVGVLGSLLGILMMIPMRHLMIVEQHNELKYPEGTACAEVLKAAANKNSRQAAGLTQSDDSDEMKVDKKRAFIIFGGFSIGLLYKCINLAFKGWKDTPEVVFGAPLKGGSIGVEVSPELLGVGYIIGPRVATVMAAGGVMSYLFIIPMIKFFGDALTVPVAPGIQLISEMDPHQIRSAYVLYIGAGAVAMGGLISLVRALPLIWHSLSAGLSGLAAATVLARTPLKGTQAPRPPTFPQAGESGEMSCCAPFTSETSVMTTLRTDQEIPMKWVLIGCMVIITAITLATPLHMNLLGALLILVFGFLFSTVSSRLTGEIGSSSNPISGLTVATLLFTCLIFLLMGWTGNHYYVTALSVGAIVCIAASNAGNTSQDLKTGFLVGSTPRLQQYAILIGALSSALILGPILLKLNDAATVYVPAAEVAQVTVVDVSKIKEKATLTGPQAATDSRAYFVWRKTDELGGPSGKYLVDDGGKLAYFVDPGINGTHITRPDGTTVKKFDAPKAVLVSYIIKGILDHQLPWALVLFGVMISLILEMSGIPSLAFAVGVYLPLSSSMPLFVGGVVRWLVDRRSHKMVKYQHLTEDEKHAASDRSPGVLLASGYIAGGALAGILIAITTGVLTHVDEYLTKWATHNNPFFEGANADLLTMLPYALIVILLYWVGREKIK